MPKSLKCSLELPANFKPRVILSFHQRDTIGNAEIVSGNCLQKGFFWETFPACLTLTFMDKFVEAELDIESDITEQISSSIQQNVAYQFELMVKRMCGLHQPIERFEFACLSDPLMGDIIRQQSGLRIPVTSTPFEALTWAITGQQISVSAAVSIRRRLIAAVNIRHRSGLFCTPDAAQILKLTEEQLRQAGFSKTKANTLLTVAKLVNDQTLPFESGNEQWNDYWHDSEKSKLPVTQIQQQLSAIKGIGSWTVNYVLLRGFGWLDSSLHGDVAVRKALQRCLTSHQRATEQKVTTEETIEEKLSAEFAASWLTQFKPWRSLIAAHLWASLSDKGY